MRRITLGEMTRFKSVDSFFMKHPASSSALLSREATPSAPSSDGSQNHRYAVGRQQVGNVGGSSYVSVYQPTVNSNEIFSLAQQWYSGGSGSNLQTVEVGWQVFPTKYGNSSPCLFIFYTPDGYASGSYNLDNTNTFVQLHNTYTIGGALPNVSTVGGDQQALRITAYLSNNAWWLYVGGVTDADILGYYPTSLFNGGALTTAADTIDFGGETVSGYPPNGEWGPMGSGNPGTAGWQQAAYHCYCVYYGTDNSANWANLTQVGPSSCYTFNPAFDNVSWGSYFFFGGAGGNDC